MATVYEMLGGGSVLTVAALALGQGGELAATRSSRARSQPGYTSPSRAPLIGFTAYAWLLRNAPISQVVTHQYVNPLVAIVLGAVLLGETLDATTPLGALIGSAPCSRRSGARAGPLRGARARAATGRGRALPRQVALRQVDVRAAVREELEQVGAREDRDGLTGDADDDEPPRAPLRSGKTRSSVSLTSAARTAAASRRRCPRSARPGC